VTNAGTTTGAGRGWRSRRFGIAAGLMLLVALYLLSGIFSVSQDEEGVVLLFGGLHKNRVGPGLHYCPPWPVGASKTLRTTTNFTMSIGFRFAEEIQGIDPPAVEMEWLSGDTNIVNLQVIVQYTVAHPASFLFATEKPQFLLRRVSEATITELVAQTRIDDILTTGRASMLEAAKLKTQAVLDQYDLGIRLVSMNLKLVEPPRAVVQSFQDVQNAKADRERLINESMGYANGILPMARGEARQIVDKARALKEQRVSLAQGEATRIMALLTEYEKAPLLTRQRLYLATMERILPGVRLYVVDPNDQSGGMQLRIVEPGTMPLPAP
jgi:membrane protease subunit HflK